MITNQDVVHFIGVLPWTEQNLGDLNNRLARQALETGRPVQEIEDAFCIAAVRRLRLHAALDSKP